MKKILQVVRGLLFQSDGDEPADGAEAAGAPRERCTVLVVDDDLSLLETVRGLLSQAGYNVLTSSSGPKGLNMLRYAPRDISVLLLDFHMPNFSGADTIQYVRRLAPNCRVIGLSATQFQQLPETFRTTADAFLEKPFTSAALLQCIESVRQNGHGTQAANATAPATQPAPATPLAAGA